MATLIGRTRVAPDVPLETAPVLIEGLREFRVRLNPNVIDFDDPDLRITVSIWLSTDAGVTWGYETLATIVGGARGKDGNFPFVGVGFISPAGEIPFPAGTLARVRYQHNLSKRIGLDSETR